MNSKKLMRLNEFCQVGKLEKYRATLMQLFDDIEAAGCKISSRYEKKTSSHEFYPNDDCLMRICLTDFYEEPIHIIWSILHEYGHHLSGPHVGLKNRIEREILAWKLARPLVSNYPALANQLAHFDNYSELCLKSYTDHIKAGTT